MGQKSNPRNEGKCEANKKGEGHKRNWEGVLIVLPANFGSSPEREGQPKRRGLDISRREGK